MNDDQLIEEATRWFARMRCDLPTEEDQRAFQEWHNRDATHRQVYAQVVELWKEVGKIPDPRNLQMKHPSLSQTVPHQNPTKSFRRRNRDSLLVGGLLFLMTFLLWTLNLHEDILADFVTEVGKIETVHLSDGSVVYLNTDTAIALDFTDKRRHITLYRGEAYFDVTSDPNRPFEVETRNVVAQALGTSFNVHESKEAVTITVAEGLVRVLRNTDEKSRADGNRTLGHGEHARVRTNGRISQHRVEVDRLVSWKENKLVFTNQPLHSVVAELDRYKVGAMLVLDSSIADQRFTGVLHLHDINLALAAIEKSLSLDVIHVTPYLTLLRGQYKKS